uniref:Uncharacterized protein n=1 Tax=Larimichthys crocea TaxID=215358 RepID=A0A0F8ATW7_LARCR
MTIGPGHKILISNDTAEGRTPNDTLLREGWYSCQHSKTISFEDTHTFAAGYKDAKVNMKLSYILAFFEKEDTFYPRCITIWPLYDPVRHDATVWPRAGSHIGHFRPIRILCCASLAATGDETESGDGIGLASQRANTTNVTAKKEKKKKIRHNTTSILICEVDNVPLFMIHLILLDKKRFGFPAVFALHSSSTLFTLRLCFVTTLGDSYCLQVTGSTER